MCTCISIRRNSHSYSLYSIGHTDRSIHLGIAYNILLQCDSHPIFLDAKKMFIWFHTIKRRFGISNILNMSILSIS